MAGRAGAPKWVATNRLQFYIDASEPSCYPGTGSNVFNLASERVQQIPVYIKNYAKPYSNWGVKRAVWSTASVSEITPPTNSFNDTVWKLIQSNSLFGNSLQRYDLSTDTDAGKNLGAWSSSIFVAGHPSNSSATVNISHDMSDGRTINVTVGSSSTWQEIITHDYGYNRANNSWFDLTLKGQDNDIFYICDPQWWAYEVDGEIKETRLLQSTPSRLGFTSSSLVGNQVLTYDAQLINGPVWVDNGVASYFDLDGTNDYIALDNALIMAKDTTFHIVFASSVIGSQDQYAWIINGDYPNNSGQLLISASNEFYTRRSEDERPILTKTYTDTTVISSSFNLNQQFTDLNIVTEGDKTVKIYIDGELVLPTGSLQGNSTAMGLGSFFGPAPACKFALAQFYKTALTPQQVKYNWEIVKKRFKL